MNLALKGFILALFGLSLLTNMVADDDIYNTDVALEEGGRKLLSDPYADIKNKTELRIELKYRWDIIDRILTKYPELTKNIHDAFFRALNAKADQIYWKHQLPYIMAAVDENTKADRLISALEFSAGTRYTNEVIERFALKVIGDDPERRCRFSAVHVQLSGHYALLSDLRELALSGKISDYKLVAYDYHTPYLDRTEPEVKYDLPLLGREETGDYRRKKAAWLAKQKAQDEFMINNPDKYYAQELFKCIRLKKGSQVKLDLKSLFMQIAEYGGRVSNLDQDGIFLKGGKNNYAVIDTEGQIEYLLAFPSGYDHLRLIGFSLLQFIYDENGEIINLAISHVYPYDRPEILKMISQALYREE